MLDSDDLLGKDYLQRAADFVLEDDHVDIIPGCMRNFDAGAGEHPPFVPTSSVLRRGEPSDAGSSSRR